MNRPLISIYMTIVLDAMGIGIIFPILPSLLKDISHTDNVSLFIGLITVLYAIMQFLFAPLLGALSDRLGRKPVLLLSMGGAVISYLLLSVATTLSLLILGRIIAGITGASLSVAMAYMTDISSAEQRPRRFGLFNAMFGIGFIIGPVIGGLLSDYWVRLPFIAALLLNGCNFLLTLFVLPEPHAKQNHRVDLSELNPLHFFHSLSTKNGLFPIVIIFFILSFAGEAYGICWAMWGQDAFEWNGFMVGLSLGIFGLFQALVQAFLPGPVVRVFGEKGTILSGILCLCAALSAMAFATEGWVIFLIMPLFAIGGIGTPALQSLATNQVDPDMQGRFQGLLSSTISFASIIAPIFFSGFYFAFRNDWPGAVWLIAAIVNVVAIPLVFHAVKFDKK
ncbi:TCR/Tet family MFS transporter [Providencia burhodogranariea]|uniref:Major facilitator superfamily protein n=1 Tax=Providencia burhodogranariea DSM 19968 TaxID=1141662 RepID=K8WW01_9GAMM|nr:major facilitator superfamily protein [Providencia burhodogranariea DSM 19968]